MSAKKPEEELQDRFMTLRIPHELHQALREQAQAQTRTLAAQVLHYIKRGIAADQKRP